MQEQTQVAGDELPGMRGNRFKPLTREAMTPAQRAMVESVMQHPLFDDFSMPTNMSADANTSAITGAGVSHE